MTGRDPKLVELAWDVCHQFLLEWQVNPYRWDQEIDVQAELASRLATLCRLTGQEYVIDNNQEAPRGFEGRQEYGRVACEPAVRYLYSDGREHTCYPDVVLWDDCNEPDRCRDHWPVLWACEIKYHGRDPQGWDLEKLRYLVSRGTVVKYGCWIQMIRRRAKEGDGMRWERADEAGRIWTIEAWLPA